MDKPHEKYPALAKKRIWLGRLLDHHQELVKRFFAAGGGAIFPVDLFMLGVANRSYHVLDAYLDAFDKWNVYAAGPLVRLQLDNLVRVCYLATRVTEPHDFVMRLMGGEEFRRIKHNDGEPLRDRKLVDLGSDIHKWLPPVYAAASGWVHLSPIHLTANLSVDEGKKTLGMAFRQQQELLPPRFLAEIQGAMSQATEQLFGYIEVWEHRKDNPSSSEPSTEDPPEADQ